VLGSDHSVASRCGEFAGLTEQFFDVPGEFSHGRIMTGPRGTFLNTGAGDER